jgi:hypothetical protein
MKHEAFDPIDSHADAKVSSNLLGGFIIVMGVIMLLGATGISIAGTSPWLLFALLPVYWIVATAHRHFKEDGRVSRRVVSLLAFGLLPFAYVGGAILGLNVAAIWPIGLIVVGASFILFGSGK